MAEKNMSAKRICINRGGWSNGGRSVSEFATRIVRMSQVIVSLLESSLLLGGEDQHRVGMATAKRPTPRRHGDGETGKQRANESDLRETLYANCPNSVRMKPCSVLACKPLDETKEHTPESFYKRGFQL